jgi:precorrin-6B methylase 2
MTAPFHAPGRHRLDEADLALLALLRGLKAASYHFVTPTPASHARVLARPGRTLARGLRDIFGWSLPFGPDVLAPDLRDCLARGGVLEERDGLLRSNVRVSVLHGDLYLHSAYPTEAEDSVFFGPDSYRFARLIASELAGTPPRTGAQVADIGAGAGVGAIVAARACPQARLIATDVNPKALRLARINAAAAGVAIETVEASGLEGLATALDLVMLNPPYLMDEAGRTYRDGGGMHGDALSLDLTVTAMGRLAPGGRIILYTGSAIVDGRDALADALRAEAASRGLTLDYREIDPDVFGEELAKPPYRDVERIAVVGAVVSRA